MTNMKITIATTAAGVEAVAGRWDEITIASPHASRRLYTLVNGASGTDSRPHVVLLEDGDREPILVAGRVERRPLRVTVGYRTLFDIDARWLTVVPGGVVGARTDSDYAMVMRCLLDPLRRGAADLLELSKVTVAGPLARAATTHLSWYRRGGRAQPQKHHRAILDDGLDAYLARRSRNTRQRLRRRLRAIEQAGERLTIHRIGPDDDVQNTCRMLEMVAAKSYQRGLGAGFVHDELHQGLVGWAVGGGTFRVWLLSIDAIPVAFLSGLVHDRTFFLFDTAFDPSFSDDEPGGLLLARILAELAEDPAIDAFDFAFGDAQYKQSLSDESWEEMDILGFAARPRPLSLNILHSGVGAASSLAIRMLGEERIAAMRRRGRARLAEPLRRAS
jgi:hypothetical protein